MTMPNFLLIGANRAGTTSMHWYLEQHPEIYVSPEKEPTYFTLAGLTNESLGRANNSTLVGTINNLADYQALFDGVGVEKAIGELSTSYLYSSDAARKIRADIPEVKLIAILRNPVERAYSNFLAYREWGIEQETSFAKAIKREIPFLGKYDSNEWCYLRFSFYSHCVKLYQALFPRHQLKFLLFDELQRDPVGFVSSIYQFLEVDLTHEPRVRNRENESARDQSGNLIKPLERPQRLHLQEIFRQDVEELESLLECDLSAWLND